MTYFELDELLQSFTDRIDAQRLAVVSLASNLSQRGLIDLCEIAKILEEAEILPETLGHRHERMLLAAVLRDLTGSGVPPKFEIIIGGRSEEER